MTEDNGAVNPVLSEPENKLFQALQTHDAVAQQAINLRQQLAATEAEQQRAQGRIQGLAEAYDIDVPQFVQRVNAMPGGPVAAVPEPVGAEEAENAA